MHIFIYIHIYTYMYSWIYMYIYTYTKLKHCAKGDVELYLLTVESPDSRCKTACKLGDVLDNFSRNPLVGHIRPRSYIFVTSFRLAFEGDLQYLDIIVIAVVPYWGVCNGLWVLLTYRKWMIFLAFSPWNPTGMCLDMAPRANAAALVL